MAHLTYHAYPGYGDTAKRDFHYSQAVRIGDRIECSGQGGWDPATSALPPSLAAQIDRAFANCALALTTAGGSGWDQVYKLVSYHIGLDDETLAHMVRNLRQHCPGHQPIWTAVGVEKLGLPGMQVEVEVVAHVGR